jgi:hypothetical protein
MDRYASNIWVVAGFAIAFVSASMLLSYFTGKWHWFGRSGAVATLAEVVLSVRPLVRMGRAGWPLYMSTIDGGHAAPTEEEIESARQTDLDARAAQLGAVLAVLGTLIWAYGDLLGGLPS